MAIKQKIQQTLRFCISFLFSLLSSSSSRFLCYGAKGFNAAVAGSFFAIETLLRPFRAKNSPLFTTAMIILASVISSTVSIVLLGTELAFTVPPYDLKPAAELPLYLILGILCGAVSVAFSRLVYLFNKSFEYIRENIGTPSVVCPALSGLGAASAPTVRCDSLSENVTTLEKSRMNDPVEESLSNSLQCSPQEGHDFERDFLLFPEIGIETLSPGDNWGMSVGPTDDQLDSAQISRSASSYEVTGISTLLENIKNLQVKLGEVRTLLEAKDSRAFEIESRIDEGTVTIQPGICTDTKLDNLLKQKLKSEDEGLALAKSIAKLQCAARGLTNPLRRHKNRDSINVEMMSKQSATEENILLVKKLATSSKKSHKDFMVAEDIVKLLAQKLKAISFFLLQFIPVVLVFWWFMLQLPPQRRTFVPT